MFVGFLDKTQFRIKDLINGLYFLYYQQTWLFIVLLLCLHGYLITEPNVSVFTFLLALYNITKLYQSPVQISCIITVLILLVTQLINYTGADLGGGFRGLQPP